MSEKIIIGILVCQSQEILNHKKRDGKESEKRYCFWELARFPSRIKYLLHPETTGSYSESAKAPGPLWIYDENDLVFKDFEVRLYFATKGIVRGYFVCKACNKDEWQLRFFSESWVPVKKKTKIKPSQGWRYFNE